MNVFSCSDLYLLIFKFYTQINTHYQVCWCRLGGSLLPEYANVGRHGGYTTGYISLLHSLHDRILHDPYTIPLLGPQKFTSVPTSPGPTYAPPQAAQPGVPGPGPNRTGTASLLGRLILLTRAAPWQQLAAIRPLCRPMAARQCRQAPCTALQLGGSGAGWSRLHIIELKIK